MSTRKHQKKIDKYKKQWSAHNDWLKSIGLPKESLETYLQKRMGKYKPKLKGVKSETSYRRPSPNIPSADSYEASKAEKKPEKKYTGDKLLGIATMHKSNMVPVFKQEDAEDIAKMRRN